VVCQHLGVTNCHCWVGTSVAAVSCAMQLRDGLVLLFWHPERWAGRKHPQVLLLLPRDGLVLLLCHHERRAARKHPQVLLLLLLLLVLLLLLLWALHESACQLQDGCCRLCCN